MNVIILIDNGNDDDDDDDDEAVVLLLCKFKFLLITVVALCQVVCSFFWYDVHFEIVFVG